MNNDQKILTLVVLAFFLWVVGPAWGNWWLKYGALRLLSLAVVYAGLFFVLADKRNGGS